MLGPDEPQRSPEDYLAFPLFVLGFIICSFFLSHCSDNSHRVPIPKITPMVDYRFNRNGEKICVQNGEIVNIKC